MSVIDWTGTIKTRGGKFGSLLPADGWQAATGDKRRRVRVFKHGQVSGDTRNDPYTIWLCAENGKTRGDGADSQNDIVTA